MSTSNDMLEALLGPTGPQVSCEECFERLDEYVEMELEGADAETRVRGCGPTSRAAPHAPRTTRASARSSVAELERLVAQVTHACSGSGQADRMSQDEPTREQAERAMRQLLADHDLPEPDEILDHEDGGIVCLWHEPKVAVVVDLEPRAA